MRKKVPPAEARRLEAERWAGMVLSAEDKAMLKDRVEFERLAVKFSGREAEFRAECARRTAELVEGHLEHSDTPAS